MKIRILVAAFAVCTGFALSACSNPAEGYASAQGSVGSSQDDALVFAADRDTNQVYVFDTRSEQRVAAIKVGASPEKVLVGRDDTVYVTNRMGRSISVIRRGEWQEAARIDVGIEPVSMALTSDGKTLYVVSSTSLESADYGVLTAIDTHTLSSKWELAVGHEPRGLALMEGNRAVVSLFKDGDVVLVDLLGPKVLKSSTDLFQKLNSATLDSNDKQVGSPSPGFDVVRPTSRARGIEALVVSPDGRQVFAAARLSSDSRLASTTVTCTGPNCQPADKGFPGNSGSGYSGRTCGATAVSAPALLTFDNEGNPMVDDIVTCSAPNADRPPMFLTSGNATIPIQGPSAAVVDWSGDFVFVVNHDSNNVAIVATNERQVQPNNVPRGFDLGAPNFGGGTVKSVVAVGAGPTGIALARDGKRAWVYNSLDHSLSRIESVDGSLRTVKTIVLGNDILAEDVVIGRKLFFSTTDSRMNSLGTEISCSTCHLDGREDGHVWNFTAGPRQTPTLAGRMLDKTEPLHWDGEFANMGDLSHAITNRMGGQGITPQMSKQISAFIASMPAADNPHRLTQKTAAQLRGAQVFTKANCNTCHVREELTDNGFANVGTVVTTGNVRDDVTRLTKGFNTPSLLGIARSAPYLHDGSALTLKARIIQGKADNKHGLTSQLSTNEVDDLVAYLQTL